MLKRLDQPEFREAVRFTPQQVEILDRIANGRPPRNAQAILKAMDMKAAFAYSKPKQELELTGDAARPLAVTFKFVGGVGKDGKPVLC